MSTPKYTPDELRDMARAAMRAHYALDPRWLVLLANLSLRTGMSLEECSRGIRELAQ